MSLKHGILGLLTYGSMTGYELMKVFNDSLTFFWNAQTSQIYRELETMEKKEWVSSKQVVQEDKPNKKVFTIQEKGENELKCWIDGHSVKDMMKIRDVMTMRIFFGSKGSNNKLKKDLEEYRNINKEFLVKLKNVEKNLEYYEKLVGRNKEKIYWIMAIKRGVKTAEANISWVDESLELLN